MLWQTTEYEVGGVVERLLIQFVRGCNLPVQ